VTELSRAIDATATSRYVDDTWTRSIVPQLVDYIRIPNKSPHFDAEWESHGHMDQAVTLIADWCRQRPIKGLDLTIVRLPGRTPLIFMEIPGSIDKTIVLYGHLDKQPEMAGWREGYGPWIPRLEGDRLYGRGGADDGYAAFASLCAIESLQAQGIDHARCVVIIEACEESGSFDLPAYIDHLLPRIGQPDLVVCLDSGAGNYEQLWLTTSLRGNLTATLQVETVSEGIHSGDASGVVPSSFRVLRMLLDRIEDARTGKVLLPELSCEIPPERVRQARDVAAALGDEVYTKYPFVEGARPLDSDCAELVLNRTWRPTLCITGAEGLPSISDAGNVLRPGTSAKLSLRLAPLSDPEAASAALVQALTVDPPYGARVTLRDVDAAQGWHAPPLADWLETAVNDASRTYFGRDAIQMGEGGTIPFMGMLSDKFPEAQFVITGVLGPASNAHGPNEFLHLPMARKLTACVAQIIADHARQP
jgi:acetylornithine deacetylase/succinyl-diaminopimelate desuccinylase-like protein